ncbi:hypothetical protein L9F63_021693, partial [Diploptera punctata]
FGVCLIRIFSEFVKTFGAPFGTSATPNLHQRILPLLFRVLLKLNCLVFDGLGAIFLVFFGCASYRLYTAFECFITGFPITAKCAALAPPSVSCLIHYMFPSNVFHVLCYAVRIQNLRDEII